MLRSQRLELSDPYASSSDDELPHVRDAMNSAPLAGRCDRALDWFAQPLNTLAHTAQQIGTT